MVVFIQSEWIITFKFILQQTRISQGFGGPFALIQGEKTELGWLFTDIQKLGKEPIGLSASAIHRVDDEDILLLGFFERLLIHRLLTVVRNSQFGSDRVSNFLAIWLKTNHKVEVSAKLILDYSIACLIDAFGFLCVNLFHVDEFAFGNRLELELQSKPECFIFFPLNVNLILWIIAKILNTEVLRCGLHLYISSLIRCLLTREHGVREVEKARFEVTGKTSLRTG